MQGLQFLLVILGRSEIIFVHQAHYNDLDRYFAAVVYPDFEVLLNHFLPVFSLKFVLPVKLSLEFLPTVLI